MRILVVEDNQTLLAVTAERLTEEGFEVLTASKGPDALTIMQSQAVDVLFADLLMPGMSGLELAHQAQRRLRDIRVILTSGVVPLDDLLPGHMQFIRKPYQIADLVSSIRKAN